MDIGTYWDSFIFSSNHTIITEDDKSTDIHARINKLLQDLDSVYESDTKAIKNRFRTRNWRLLQEDGSSQAYIQIQILFQILNGLINLGSKQIEYYSISITY